MCLDIEGNSLVAGKNHIPQATAGTLPCAAVALRAKELTNAVLELAAVAEALFSSQEVFRTKATAPSSAPATARKPRGPPRPRHGHHRHLDRPGDQHQLEQPRQLVHAQRRRP